MTVSWTEQGRMGCRTVAVGGWCKIGQEGLPVRRRKSKPTSVTERSGITRAPCSSSRSYARASNTMSRSVTGLLRKMAGPGAASVAMKLTLASGANVGRYYGEASFALRDTPALSEHALGRSPLH